MPTYLHLLPDELYIKIYEHVNRPALDLAAQRGGRRQIAREGNKTNQAVVWHWMNGKPFKSLSMHTDGRDLFSYQLCIGHTVRETDEKVLRDYTAKGRYGYCSQTTSQHVNIVRRYADRECCGD
eukprot:SAG22_NODE_871_length_6748_cov_60.669274_5_plen_124_part_00